MKKQPLSTLILHEKRIAAENTLVQREQAYQERLLGLKDFYDGRLQRQNKRHVAQVDKLEQEYRAVLVQLSQARRENRQQVAVLGGDKVHCGFFVQDWKRGWRWFSSWAFLLIMFVATVPIPQAFLDVLPMDVRQAVVALVAIMGWVLRFVNQKKSGGV